MIDSLKDHLIPHILELDAGKEMFDSFMRLQMNFRKSVYCRSKGILDLVHSMASCTMENPKGTLSQLFNVINALNITTSTS